MNNQKILEERWKIPDRELRNAYPKLKRVFREILDESADLFGSTGINRDNLNKKVPDRLERKVIQKIREWPKNDYLEFMAAKQKRTYFNVFSLLLLGMYCEKFAKIIEISNAAFYVSAQTVYLQAQNDLKDLGELVPFPDVLDKKYVEKLLNVPVLEQPYYEYIQSMTIEFSQELRNKYLFAANQDLKPDEKDIEKLLKKQSNRILDINDGKYSGGMESVMRNMCNTVYYDPFPNQKVMFIAELDERTTRMCQSLDGQIFNTKYDNEFVRFSASQGHNIRYHIKGLQQGINQPPINDHFHWCRSTLKFV